MTNKKVVLFQPKAKEDLELIFEYTETTWGYEQADRYLDRLYQTINSIRDYPELGTKYISNLTVYRKIIVGKHIIYYRNLSREILIVRILHSTMNRNNLL